MDQPVAIITGAGRGIGRAAAVELAGRGYRLALVARTVEHLEQTRQVTGGDALVVAADVTRVEAVDAAVARTLDRFGRLDVLVNNAGMAPVRSIEQMTPEEWHATIDTNLSAVFYLCRAAWPAFVRQKGGVVVNVSSVAARDPFPGFLAYGTAKAALNLFGAALAREGEPIGVRVHTVAPAATETEMLRQVLSKEQYPTEKTLDPADVARVIGQCVAGDLRYTSGEVIYLHKTM